MTRLTRATSGLAAIALAAVALAGCSPDEGRIAEPVVTSAAASPSVAVPSSPAPASTTPPSSLPASTNRTVATRPTVSSEPNGTSAPATSAPATSALGTASPTGTTDDGVPSGTAAFNQAFQFPSGLKVNVTRPTTFTPSAEANVPNGLTYVWVTVTLQNSAATPIDLGVIGHDATAGGVEAVRIFDPANAILPAEGDPGALAPGQVLSYRVGFAQMARESLQVRTMYGWDGQVIHA